MGDLPPPDSLLFPFITHIFHMLGLYFRHIQFQFVPTNF